MDLMTRRRALLARAESGGRLPREYQEVEYLESSGTQAIYNTVNNVSPNTFGFEAKSMMLEKPSGAQSFSSYWTRWGSGTVFNMGLSSYNGYKLVNTNVSGYATSFGIDVGYAVGDTAIMSLHGNTLTYNGSDYAFNRQSSDLVNGYVPIFCTLGNYGTYRIEYCYGRCYYYRLYDGDTLLCDNVPCYRKSDQKPGMYDLVSNTFLINVGTGEFTVGADVN